MLASTSKQYVAEAELSLESSGVCCETKSAGERSKIVRRGSRPTHAFTRAQANRCGEVKYIAATRSNG